MKNTSTDITLSKVIEKHFKNKKEFNTYYKIYEKSTGASVSTFLKEFHLVTGNYEFIDDLKNSDYVINLLTGYIELKKDCVYTPTGYLKSNYIVLKGVPGYNYIYDIDNFFYGSTYIENGEKVFDILKSYSEKTYENFYYDIFRRVFRKKNNNDIVIDKKNKIIAHSDIVKDRDDFVISKVSDYNIARYHSLSRCSWMINQLGWKIGFEIEKEDTKFFNKKDVVRLWSKFGWCKEKDSSLSQINGFELVSPIFDLFENNILTESLKSVKSYIDCEYSFRCGGHINLSCSFISGEELFRRLEKFFPILYSLYKKRLHIRHSQVKRSEDYLTSDKYAAIFLKKSGIIEFRIFPAVENLNNLQWRIDLIKLFIKYLNPIIDRYHIYNMLCNESEIKNHLEKILSPKRIDDISKDYIDYSNTYLGKPLENIKEHLEEKNININQYVYDDSNPLCRLELLNLFLKSKFQISFEKILNFRKKFEVRYGSMNSQSGLFTIVDSVDSVVTSSVATEPTRSRYIHYTRAIEYE